MVDWYSGATSLTKRSWHTQIPLLLCCFQAFEISGSDARLRQFTCLIRVNAARRFDRSQFQQGKSHELPSLLDDADGKKKVKIISGYHVLVAC
jgi:hypothetical protein